jgi:O-acetyl-ADP-ribose deacetylase (regulator of RNase III)
LAEQNKIERIALPAIGTGIYGFPMSDAIKIYADAAKAFSAEAVLKEIRFVFTTSDNAKSFLWHLKL